MPGIVTVITPPLTDALTSLATVKLDLNVSYTEDDAFISSLIERTSGVIASWIGRPLGLQTIAESFRRVPGSYHLGLPGLPSYVPYYTNYALNVRPLLTSFVPIASISSIVEDTTTLTAGVDYEVEAKSGLLWRLAAGTRITWNGLATVVTYVAGYALPNDTGRNLPQEIEDVALNLIRSAYFSRGQDPSITLELVEGIGRTVYSPTRGGGLDDHARAVLASYRQSVW